MQRVLSKDLWKEIRSAAKHAKRRNAAIAYVTKDSIGLRRGDVLIVDASKHTIASGGTSADLLRKLLKRGVALYNCPDLHAKVILLDEVAVLCSANMSASSANRLVEVGVLTDHGSTVSGIASFLAQLTRQSDKLNRQDVVELCKIRVARKSGLVLGPKKPRTTIGRLGNRTWLIGVHEIVAKPSLKEQKLIDRATASLHKDRKNLVEDFNWVKWGTKGRFVRDSREGDSLIQIFRSNRAKRPSVVLRATAVLRKQKTNKWTRFYHLDGDDAFAELQWGKFKRLLRQLGYSRRVGAGSIQLLESDVADAIKRKWKTAFRL
jgi:hypothetical protein